MKPIFFIIVPLAMAFIVTVTLGHLSMEKNNRNILKIVMTSGFLILSSIVANVIEPAINSLIYGDFYSEIGIVGFVKRIVITLVIYFFIIISLSKIIKFKSTKHKFAYIFAASIIYGIFFNYFLRVF